VYVAGFGAWAATVHITLKRKKKITICSEQDVLAHSQEFSTLWHNKNNNTQ
jgi:hypothetical protein